MNRRPGESHDVVGGDSVVRGRPGDPRAVPERAGRPGARARGPRVVVIAGTGSGVGKTTIVLGLLEALGRRGLVVQPFKVGPDFIDPGFHTLVTGRASHNLDGWMCGRDHVRATVARHAADADVVVVEGVMGCFDGYDGTSEAGSTAEVAKWLGAPVVLVVDARGQSRSAAATVLGFERFDPELTVAGVIANRVGSARHATWVAEAVRRWTRAEPLGALARDGRLGLPERHLGLVTAAEGALDPERRRALGDAIAAGVDLDRLLEVARPLAITPEAAPKVAPAPAPDVPPEAALKAAPPGPPRVRIGVARDAAFQFYYADNLDRLAAAGAELVPWSPLESERLPEVDGLYLGGGYPELHGARLAANTGVLAALRAFIAAGRPVYAECGGLMYLAASLGDLDGRRHALVGALPADVRMLPRKLTLGYTDVEFAENCWLGPAGTRARGHEFHYSTLDPVPEDVPRAWRLARRSGVERREGYQVGGALMSYVHLHFASNPALAPAFVAACADAARARDVAELTARSVAATACYAPSGVGPVPAPRLGHHRSDVQGVGGETIPHRRER